MSIERMLTEIENMPAREFARLAEGVHAREDILIQAEVRRRYDELKSGTVRGLTREEVFDRIEERLK